MARIPTYAIDTVFDSNDLLLGTDGSTTALITKNFRVGGLTDHIIDQLIEPNATDFHIPVFHTGGTRITDSIISQNDYPNGTTISVGGGLSVSGGAGVSGALSVGGAITCSDRIIGQDSIGVLGSLANGSGKLVIGDNEGINSVKITIPSYSDGSAQYGNLPATSSYSLIFPPNAGNFNQQLTTDGTGILSWKDDIILDCPNSIYIGTGAGESDPCNASADPSQGSIGPLFNIGIGTNAIKSQGFGTNPVTGDTIPGENIGIGISALKATTTGTNNIAIGSNSLASNVTGYNNVAISKNALGSVVNASQNMTSNNTSIGIGFSAGNPNVNATTIQSRIGDTIVGHQAAADQIHMSSGSNTYIGLRAGRKIMATGPTGSLFGNTIIGVLAGFNVKGLTGASGTPFFNSNIFIGEKAGQYVTGQSIRDNILMGSNGDNPRYLRYGNIVFTTGNIGNRFGTNLLPSGEDGGVSDNLVIGNNIHVFGDKNIVMNPNQDSNYNVGGIYIGNAAGNIDTYQNDHTQNIILGGGAEADISINTIFQGTGVNNRAQNQNNTIVNSNGITLSSWSQYDVQKNFIVNSKDLNISAQYAGGAGSGADVHGNSFINCSGMTSNARLKGNTFLNFTGTLPNSGDGGIQNNLIIGRFNVETYLDMRPGSDNNIVGNGNSFTIQGDGNLMFGVSNNKIWNSGNSNLVFGQNQSVGQESGSTRAQRSLIFGFNQTVATQNQIQNSIIAGQGNELKNSSINSNINNSIAVGQNLEGNTSNAAYFGKNNNPTTIANHPELFVVGCGQGTGARRNALAVLEKKNNTAYGRGVVMMEQTVMANFADDAAAGVGGLEIGAIYHTNGTLKIKIS